MRIMKRLIIGSCFLQPIDIEPCTLTCGHERTNAGAKIASFQSAVDVWELARTSCLCNRLEVYGLPEVTHFFV